MNAVFRSLLAALAMSISVAASADTFWVACDNCGIMARQQVAGNFLAPNSIHEVYVVDSVNRDLSKFEVLNEIEPGSYNIEVNMIDVEASVASASQALFNELAELTQGDIELPGDIVDCDDGAASYIVSLNCRGHVRERFEQQYFGPVGALSSLTAFLGISSQALNAHLGMNRSVVLTFRFPDGSTIRVEATFGTNGEGFTVVSELKLLEARSEDGTFLPIDQDQLAQFSSNSVSGASLGDLMVLWESWGVRSLSLCNREYQSRTRCGLKDGVMTCTVEGTIACN